MNPNAGKTRVSLRENDTCTSRSAFIRSNRYFKLYDDWYFTTREGTAVGPFPTREDAEEGVRDFIEFVQGAPASVVRLFFEKRAAQR